MGKSTRVVLVLFALVAGCAEGSIDRCPEDDYKEVPGVCGCGIADDDRDEDGTLDCMDECADDPAKVDPGVCGCGVSDADSDLDSAPDCDDECPSDAAKLSAGMCGCGVPDTDTDLDGTADCTDECPADPAKTAPGVCGCGIADGDSDGDGAINCEDGCPMDPQKTESGVCGCGVSDADSDGDATEDCLDGCPTDAGKTAPGDCGCGVADTDGDGDGVPDCSDACPGIPDGDTDGDGVSNCVDNCPAVANPSADVADTLTAPVVTNPFGGTGHVCDDGATCPVGSCDVAANGSAPEHGICQALGYDQAVSVVWGSGPGESDNPMPHAYNWSCSGYVCMGNDPYQSDNCSTSEMLSTITCQRVGQPDGDHDGAGDACDGCPADAGKTAPGTCGCGVAETDTDGDATPDCLDLCPTDPTKITDTDTDGDGRIDCTDNCPTVANTADVTAMLTAPVVTNPFGGTGHVCDDGATCIETTCDVSTNGSAPEHGICQALGYDRATSVTWGYGPGDADSTMPHAYNWSCTAFVCTGANSYQSDNCVPSEMLSSITCLSPGQRDGDGDGVGDACDPTP